MPNRILVFLSSILGKFPAVFGGDFLFCERAGGGVIEQFFLEKFVTALFFNVLK